MMDRKISLWNSLFLAFGIGLVYANVLNAPFHFDDISLLLKNPHIQSVQGLCSRLGWDQRKYLTFVTFFLNFKLTPGLTVGYRLVNIVCHWLTAVMLALALRRLFEAPFFRKQPLAYPNFLAWGAAAVFALHPLQTDSVTYIWQRSEVLSGLFYAVVLWCYWRGRVDGLRRFGLYALGFWVIGMYAKGSIMTAPLLIAVSEVLFFETGGWFRRHAPAVIGAGLLLSAAAVVLDRPVFQVNFSVDWQYLQTQFLVIWKYIRLTLWPVGQSVDHGYQWAESFWQPQVLAGFLGLIAVFFGLIIWSRRYRLACFGAAWFFIYLLPTSSVIPLLTPIFEHRLYFSLAGFGVLACDAILRTTGNHIKRARLMLVVILSLLGTLTAARNQIWKTQEGLMQDAIRKSPDYVRPRFVLGSYYLSWKRFDDAQRMFRDCITMNPGFAHAMNNLATILERRGQTEEALALYRQAVAANPRYKDPYINLSRFYCTRGDMGRALFWIGRALDAEGEDSRVYAYAALLQVRVGHFTQAQRLLQKGFALNPMSAKLDYSQGLWFLHQGRLKEAARFLERAMRQAPDWVWPANDLGVVYFQLKDYEKARDALEWAHRLTPRAADIYLNLANVYHELGQHDKAQRYYRTSRYGDMLRYLPADFDGQDLFLLHQDE